MLLDACDHHLEYAPVARGPRLLARAAAFLPGHLALAVAPSLSNICKNCN
jgi:hypothetical protein